jgi:hypothetical protein
VLGAPKEPRIPLGYATGAAIQVLDMAVTSRNTHVVNMSYPPDIVDAFDVFISSSNDSGNSFRQATNLSSSTTNSLFPRVAARDDDVYVTWLERLSARGPRDVRVRSSRTAGETFEDPVALTSNAAEMMPEVAVTDTQAFVLYCETSGQLFVRRRNRAAGAPWQPPEQISEATVECGEEGLAASRDEVFVTWIETELPAGNSSLVVKRSVAGGEFVGAGRHPQHAEVEGFAAASPGGRVYAIFKEARSDSTVNARILYSGWSKGDGTLQQPVNLSGLFTRSVGDFAAAADGVAWNTRGINYISFSRPDEIRIPPSIPAPLNYPGGSELKGITPDVQTRGKDYYIVWREQDSRRIMLYSFREWRWDE